MFWVVGSSRLQKRAQFGLHRPTISGRPTLKADARVRTVRPRVQHRAPDLLPNSGPSRRRSAESPVWGICLAAATDCPVRNSVRHRLKVLELRGMSLAECRIKGPRVQLQPDCGEVLATDLLGGRR